MSSPHQDSVVQPGLKERPANKVKLENADLRVRKVSKASVALLDLKALRGRVANPELKVRLALKEAVDHKVPKGPRESRVLRESVAQSVLKAHRDHEV